MTILKVEVQELTNGVITVELQSKNNSKEDEDTMDLLLKAFCIAGMRKGTFQPSGKLTLAVKPAEE